jgi:hypothetical protein
LHSYERIDPPATDNPGPDAGIIKRVQHGTNFIPWHLRDPGPEPLDEGKI